MKTRLTIALLFLLLGAGRLEALNCTLNNAYQISFGIYSSALIQIAPASIDINCDSGAKYTIGLGQGSNGPRLMKSDSRTLRYQLFSDASYTLNWGDATSGSTGVSRVGVGPEKITIYAQVPANQAFYSGPNGGNYSDTVTVTLTCSNCAVISGSGATMGINLAGVDRGCGIMAKDLNFGTYIGAEVDANTTLEIGCSADTHYSVGLSAGTGTGATVTNRSMTLNGGNAALFYKLLSGSYKGSNWGDKNSAGAVTGTADGGKHSLTVYGVIPAGQSVVTGNYTDTIIATLTY